MFITENSLSDLLLSIFPNENILRQEPIKIEGKRYMPDFTIGNTIIEFDGYQHYTSAKVVNRDTTKDAILTRNGYNVIRIPYFVQIDSKIINLLFSKNVDISNNYPHGFIDKDVVMPCDYCELGLIRFSNDMVRFNIIFDDIIYSLRDKINKNGINLTLPPSLIREWHKHLFDIL